MWSAHVRNSKIQMEKWKWSVGDHSFAFDTIFPEKNASDISLEQLGFINKSIHQMIIRSSFKVFSIRLVHEQITISTNFGHKKLMLGILLCKFQIWQYLHFAKNVIHINCSPFLWFKQSALNKSIFKKIEQIKQFAILTFKGFIWQLSFSNGWTYQ